MPVFNIAQALLWICNCRERKFTRNELEARLALLAEPRAVLGRRCAPFLVVVDKMFSTGRSLPESATLGDIQKALRIISDEDPCLPSYLAPSIPQRAHDDLIEKLRKGKIAISGRRVRQPEMIHLKNGALGSIEYLPGRGPVIDLEIIPPVAFAELRFIDRDDGIEAVPMNFPAHEFPRWRDLSVVADNVRRLWPIETPIADRKRGPKPVLMEAVKDKMRRYDPEKLRKMKESEMAVVFSASESTCAAARRLVQSE